MAITQDQRTASREEREGHEMAIDYEKDEQREKQRDRREHQAVQTLARAAGAAHKASVAVGVADQLDTGGFGTASPVGAAIAIGESLEEGLSGEGIEERLERFPELRDVEVPVGVAARFPELHEGGRRHDASEIDEQEIAR